MKTRSRGRVVPALAACAATVSCFTGCSASSSSSSAASADDEALASIVHHATRQVCPAGRGPLDLRCLSTIRTDVAEGFTPDFTGDALSSASYGPADLASAYSIPAGGAGTTVAVVNLGEDPKAESDLAVYRAKYNLPACTTANGCFTKVNASGKASPLPAPDYQLAQEITLDLDAVSAGCPACKILLVEADPAPLTGGAPLDPLGPGVDSAVTLGAKFVSISFGSSEATSAATSGTLKADALAAESHYVHPGVAIFVATGDAGFGTSPNNTGSGTGPQFPSDIPEVFAVGGTSLVKSGAASRGWAETVWGAGDADGAGNSGCSEFFPKPSYQTSKACKGREIADVSAVADPDTGLNFYITYTDPDTSAGDYIAPGWNITGGTSLASPLTAAIFAASGLEGVDPSFAYKNASDFHDVTTGNNGTCKESSLCKARKGYDAPTGNGTPDGALLLGK